MSSRGKKKKQYKEQKEVQYQTLKGFYDNVINTLEGIKEDYEKLTDEEFFKKYKVAKQGKLMTGNQVAYEQ